MAATATPTVPRGQVTESLVSRMGEIFNPHDGFLATYNIEREEQIELAGISLAAGVDPLFLGDPGVGKTWMIELLLSCLEGADASTDFFNTMVFKETPADDVLGPRSLPAMKEGRIERLTEGYLPTALVAYLDEVFKASPTFLNALLDIMANRKLKVGRTVHDTRQLLVIYGSSNELPDREDLNPFRDRWGITNFVNPVRSPEGRKRVMQIQDEYQSEGRALDLSDAPKLSLDDVAKIRAEVSRVILPDALLESMGTAQERWGQKGFTPSQRRIGQMLMAIKARAWMRGDGEAAVEDMIVCAHMAWNHPDHQDAAREVVLEFAAEFERRAKLTQKALEPVFAELDKVRTSLAEADGEPPDGLLEQAFEVQKDLRRLRKLTSSSIDEGKAQGHSVRALEDSLAEINRAWNWIQTTVMGDEDTTTTA